MQSGKEHLDAVKCAGLMTGEHSNSSGNQF